MRKFVVPLALLLMAVLLGTAVVRDCVRLAADRNSRVLVADGQMATQEIRLVKILENSPQTTPEVSAAISTLKSIHGRQARVQAYDALVASYRKTMPGKLDATNPLDRKLMDEADGAINRRDVAQKQYDAEASDYLDFLNSWRGSIVKKFYLDAERYVSQQAERPLSP
jgi:hypothetical protein